MTDVYILLRNFDNEGWETCSVTSTFEKACEDAKDDFKECGEASVEFHVEHWYLEIGAYVGTTELDLEKI